MKCESYSRAFFRAAKTTADANPGTNEPGNNLIIGIIGERMLLQGVKS
jgi:hypothetical protein